MPPRGAATWAQTTKGSGKGRGAAAAAPGGAARGTGGKEEYYQQRRPAGRGGGYHDSSDYYGDGGRASYRADREWPEEVSSKSQTVRRTTNGTEHSQNGSAPNTPANAQAEGPVNGSSLSASSITRLEAKVEALEKFSEQAIRKFSEKQNEKFDLIFAILTELQGRQARLEESIAGLLNCSGGGASGTPTGGVSGTSGGGGTGTGGGCVNSQGCGYGNFGGNFGNCGTGGSGGGSNGNCGTGCGNNWMWTMGQGGFQMQAVQVYSVGNCGNFGQQNGYAGSNGSSSTTALGCGGGMGSQPSPQAGQAAQPQFAMAMQSQGQSPQQQQAGQSPQQLQLHAVPSTPQGSSGGSTLQAQAAPWQPSGQLQQQSPAQQLSLSSPQQQPSADPDDQDPEEAASTHNRWQPRRPPSSLPQSAEGTPAATPSGATAGAGSSESWGKLRIWKVVGLSPDQIQALPVVSRPEVFAPGSPSMPPDDWVVAWLRNGDLVKQCGHSKKIRSHMLMPVRVLRDGVEGEEAAAAEGEEVAEGWVTRRHCGNSAAPWFEEVTSGEARKASSADAADLDEA